jgi:hypothetical protein
MSAERELIAERDHAHIAVVHMNMGLRNTIDAESPQAPLGRQQLAESELACAKEIRLASLDNPAAFPLLSGIRIDEPQAQAVPLAEALDRSSQDGVDPGRLTGLRDAFRIRERTVCRNRHGHSGAAGKGPCRVPQTALQIVVGRIRRPRPA